MASFSTRWSAVAVDSARDVGRIISRPIRAVGQRAMSMVNYRALLDTDVANDAAVAAANAGSTATSSSGPMSGMMAGTIAAANTPGPFTFIRSSFFITLMLLSIVANRIHHLVPPRRAMHENRISPTMRRLLRAPALALLSRAVLLLSVILADRAGYKLLTWFGVPTLVRLAAWSTAWTGRSELKRIMDAGLSVAQARQPDVLWEVFLAVALSSTSEVFVRALQDDLASHTSFNLLGFSFLLHINSMPMTTSSGQTAMLTPSFSLYTHLLLTTLELLSLHLNFAFMPPLPPLRLPISAFFSAISQFFVYRSIRSLWLGEWLDVQEDDGVRIAWEGTVWLNRAPEVFFEGMVLLTWFLKGLVIALRREPITAEAILGHPSHWPHARDDYAVAVIRYGTACLETTQLAGLANEVSPLRVLAPRPLALLNLQLPPRPEDREPEPFVELRRGMGSEDSEGGSSVKWRGRRRVGHGVGRETDGEGVDGTGTKGGFGTEIRSVEAAERDVLREARSSREVARNGAFLHFVAVIARIAFFIVYTAYKRSIRLIRRIAGRAGWRDDDSDMRETWVTNGRGVLQDDLDDQDWLPDGDNDGGAQDEEISSSSSSDSGSEDEDEDSDTDLNTTALVRDLTRPVRQYYRSTTPDTPDSYVPVLVAHQLTTTGSPLTRRRYQAMTSGSTSGIRAVSSAIEDRRLELSRAAWARGIEDEEEWRAERRAELEDERQSFCVVCTVERRGVVLWPCRCLCMCDDCRESLAARTPATQHLCPTCRTPVKGFSRIVSTHIAF